MTFSIPVMILVDSVERENTGENRRVKIAAA